MAMCIRGGFHYKRHKYVDGKCQHCGKVKEKK